MYKFATFALLTYTFHHISTDASGAMFPFSIFQFEAAAPRVSSCLPPCEKMYRKRWLCFIYSHGIVFTQYALRCLYCHAIFHDTMCTSAMPLCIHTFFIQTISPCSHRCAANNVHRWTSTTFTGVHATDTSNSG